MEYTGAHEMAWPLSAKRTPESRQRERSCPGRRQPPNRAGREVIFLQATLFHYVIYGII
jgi:hypothetical protein